MDSLLEISRDVDVEGGVITSSHGATRYKVPGQHVPCECDNAAERAREQNKRAGGSIRASADDRQTRRFIERQSPALVVNEQVTEYEEELGGLSAS